MNQEWIAGKNPVLAALRSEHNIHKIWLAAQTKPSGIEEIIRLAKDKGIIVQDVPKKKLNQLTEGVAHQGVVAFIAAYEYATLNDLYQKAEQKGEEPFILMLDHIEDPHNLGAILRTADAAGAHGVVIPKRRAVGLTATVAKASAGAIEYVPVVQVTNLSQTIDEFKTKGLWICGTDAQAEQDYRRANFDLPLVLVVGSEGKGMSRIVGEKCDFMVKLPLVGKISSLNASVAAGILMFEVNRQRYPLT